MNIYINDRMIDFKLESEKVLSDVVTALKEWANKEGYQFQTVHYNNNLYNNDDQNCKNFPVNDVSDIKITAKSNMEIYAQYTEKQKRTKRIMSFITKTREKLCRSRTRLCIHAPIAKDSVMRNRQNPSNRPLFLDIPPSWSAN